MPTQDTPHSTQSHHHLHNLSAEAMKPIHYALALLFLLLASSHLQTTMAASAFCASKCKVRCSKASVMDGCLKYCGLCCAQCQCVPSGTYGQGRSQVFSPGTHSEVIFSPGRFQFLTLAYGHKDECPCYRDKTTGVGKRRRPKCP